MPRIAPFLTHPVILAAGLLLLAAATAHAESRLAPPDQGARASLDFRIVIPPVVRLLENRHPDQLQRVAAGHFTARQTLVLLSNFKRGACVMLRRPADAGGGTWAWRPQALDDAQATLQPAGDGWRLCTAGPGRHTLQLQHDFEPPSDDADDARWPVITELAAI
jgi:hypothetical protein